MDYGKYIIVEVMGHEVAVLFDFLIGHGDLLQSFHRKNVKSAGFFGVAGDLTPENNEDIHISVWGESTTLGIKARINKDEKLIKRVLRNEV